MGVAVTDFREYECSRARRSKTAGCPTAKESLMLGDTITAEEGWRLGFVTKIFPPDKLNELTLAFARRIATLPSDTTLLIKEAVN
jgi:enoyl-CoA hydratase/carnithine racemase